MIIVKLDQVLIIHAKWTNLCQHTYYKLLQDKIMLLSHLCKLFASRTFSYGKSSLAIFGVLILSQNYSMFFGFRFLLTMIQQASISHVFLLDCIGFLPFHFRLTKTFSKIFNNSVIEKKAIILQIIKTKEIDNEHFHQSNRSSYKPLNQTKDA